MTTAAIGEQHGLSYVAEVTPGTTPGTPTMLQLRHISCGLKPVRPTIQSQESWGDAQLQSTILGVKGCEGPIGLELSHSVHDDMLAALLRSSWPTTQNVSGTDISAAAADNSYNSSTSDLSVFAAGDYVTVAGFSTGGNNGVAKVVSATASKMVVSGLTLTIEAAGPSVTMDRQLRLSLGTTDTSFSFERRLTDITKYKQFTGVYTNQGSLSVKPNDMAKLTLDCVGMGSSQTATLGTPTAAATNQPFNALSGTITEGGSVIATVTGIDLRVALNKTPAEVVGSDSRVAIDPGLSMVSGTLTARVTDLTLDAKFWAETESSLVFTLTDPDSETQQWNLPRTIYTGWDAPYSGRGALVQTLEFTALRDSTTGTTMYVIQS